LVILSQVSFLPHRDMGQVTKILSKSGKVGASKEIQVQCFPLFSFLSALGVDTVDYLSLDVEGLELKILRTIPFHRLRIKVISVEVITAEEDHSVYRTFMESKGYRTLGFFYHEARLFDLIFAHNSVDISPDVYDLLDKPKPNNTQWRSVVESQAAANLAAAIEIFQDLTGSKMD